MPGAVGLEDLGGVVKRKYPKKEPEHLRRSKMYRSDAKELRSLMGFDEKATKADQARYKKTRKPLKRRK